MPPPTLNSEEPKNLLLTVGKLDDSAQITKDLKERRFSTIVNAQGRVLSDIHSLLTTLPPRNDE